MLLLAFHFKLQCARLIMKELLYWLDKFIAEMYRYTQILISYMKTAHIDISLWETGMIYRCHLGTGLSLPVPFVTLLYPSVFRFYQGISFRLGSSRLQWRLGLHFVPNYQHTTSESSYKSLAVLGSDRIAREKYLTFIRWRFLAFRVFSAFMNHF